MAADPEDVRSRRSALRFAVASFVAACRGETSAPERHDAGVLLAALPEGERVRTTLGEQPVELVRRGQLVEARSLWCTHMGCEVRWYEELGHYVCPCHGGTYDAGGNVLSGPPEHALRVVATRVEGGRVWIGRAAAPRERA